MEDIREISIIFNNNKIDNTHEYRLTDVNNHLERYRMIEVEEKDVYCIYKDLESWYNKLSDKEKLYIELEE